MYGRSMKLKVASKVLIASRVHHPPPAPPPPPHAAGERRQLRRQESPRAPFGLAPAVRSRADRRRRRRATETRRRDRRRGLARANLGAAHPAHRWPLGRSLNLKAESSRTPVVSSFGLFPCLSESGGPDAGGTLGRPVGRDGGCSGRSPVGRLWAGSADLGRLCCLWLAQLTWAGSADVGWLC